MIKATDGQVDQRHPQSASLPEQQQASASEADMEVANELADFLDMVSRGDYPRAKDDEDAPDRFDQDDIDHLKALYERLAEIAIHAGALRRVVAAQIALEATADLEIVSYSVGRLASGDEVFIERASQLSGSSLWKVRTRFSCLNKSGEWEHDPVPSSRDDTFLVRCRFPIVEDAVSAARAAIAKELWMLHIHGPDDIIAAPSHAEADAVAAAFNALHGECIEKHRAEIKAVVHGWCGTPQAHAESVDEYWPEYAK